MPVAIIGAGMAGLLAGAMLRGEGRIYEAAPSLPNNHHALLRFRTDAISHHLNIPFKKVKVMKIVKPYRNRVAETIAYSLKTSAKAAVRSSVTARGEIDERFIAPPDFIEQMEAQQLSVSYDYKVDPANITRWKEEGIPVISTMPMPTLMELLGYNHEVEFTYRDGWVLSGEVSVASDMCATIYYPDPRTPVSRATLTGQSMQIELSGDYDPTIDANTDEVVVSVLEDFGLDGFGLDFELKRQRYAKIQPIPEGERRRFIMWATDVHGVYSLGRFAVWKPGLLLDDVFDDVRVIQGMIRSGNYEGRLKCVEAA
jgi:hypothetical protein